MRQKLGEETKLLREIILEARVIIQMIARDIGEGAGGERHAVDAALLQAVARGFEREMGDAVVGKRGENAMQLDRVGRGVLEHLGPARAHDADRAETGRLVSLRRPELAQEGRDRGLAVRAGDGDRGFGLATEEPRGDRARRRRGSLSSMIAHARPKRAPRLPARGSPPRRAAPHPAMKRAPSVFTPGSAANRKPGFDLAAVGRKACNRHGCERLTAGSPRGQTAHPEVIVGLCAPKSGFSLEFKDFGQPLGGRRLFNRRRAPWRQICAARPRAAAPRQGWARCAR